MSPLLPTPGGLGDTRHGDDLVTADDERPAVALRAGHLRVHEQILHFLPPACEPVARPPPRTSSPGAPIGSRVAHGCPHSTGPSSRSAVVLADGADAGAEVGRFVPSRLGQQLRELLERARQPRALVASESRFASARGSSCSSSGRISSRIRPRFVPGWTSPRGTRARAARSRRASPRARTPSSGRTTPSSRRALMRCGEPRGDEPVEDGLDLVRGGVAGRAQPRRCANE